MNFENPWWLFILISTVFVLSRIFDWDRIKSHFEDKGGKLLRMRWAPFGKGWLGEGSDRIYRVEYLDRERNHHQAFCKTSSGSGVYFTEDKIVRFNKPRSPTAPAGATDAPLCRAPSCEAIRAENQRLREALAEL